MIVRRRLHWLRMLFVWNGSVLRRILSQLTIVVLVSLIAVSCHIWLASSGLNLNPTPFSLLGIALAIFLGFRNSTSYERFVEGRRLWGQLLIASRSLMRQAATLSDPPLDRPEQLQFAQRLIALATGLKDDLRRRHRNRNGTAVASAGPSPSARLMDLARDFATLRRDGRISPVLTPAIETNLNLISAVIGGCERIANTPIPYTYSVMLHRTVYLYCLLLPFGLVSSLEVLTPPIAVFISYTFMALDAIAAELEEPFGLDPNDLPLDAMTRGLERSVLAIAGAEELPPELQPDRNYILT